jgi:hypothetical protein
LSGENGEPSSKRTLEVNSAALHELRYFLPVRVGHHNELYFLEGPRATSQDADFLEPRVAGFIEGQSALLKITYREKSATSFHIYMGKSLCVPTVPKRIAGLGDLMSVGIELLSKDQFVREVPGLILQNSVRAKWVAETVEVQPGHLLEDILTMNAVQNPPVEGVDTFQISGATENALSFSTGRVRLGFRLAGLFHINRKMGICFDGYNPPWFAIDHSGYFVRVHFLSHDGVRLRIISKASVYNTNVATIYQHDPSILYIIRKPVGTKLWSGIPHVTAEWTVPAVSFRRKLEALMVKHGSSYDHGRIGAEIAYTIGKRSLGLRDLQLYEPSRGGNDLYTNDGGTLLQARLLTDTKRLTGEGVSNVVRSHLKKMARKLETGFQYYPTAEAGYAILSYLNKAEIVRTLILRVERQYARNSGLMI